jgi:integron integrase
MSDHNGTKVGDIPSRIAEHRAAPLSVVGYFRILAKADGYIDGTRATDGSCARRPPCGTLQPPHVAWIRRYVVFHGRRHPADLGAEQIGQFLTHLAVRGKVAPPTQNQALNALLFLYRRVLGIELPWLEDIVRAKKPARLPVILTVDEVAALLAELKGIRWIVGGLLYGSGLRLMECLRLRVKDVDFRSRQLVVRSGKGAKDRVTVLAQAVMPALQQHLERTHEQHRNDCARGSGEVYLPFALRRKYPNAAREWGWQFVFPATRDVRLEDVGTSPGSVPLGTASPLDSPALKPRSAP